MQTIVPPEGGQNIDSPSLANGRYTLVSGIGQGGMALVCRAFDTRLRVFRAIKVLLPEYARRKSIRRRFEAEAQTMAQLEHPHIVRVYDVVTEGRLPYLVMELLTHGTLIQWVETHGKMPPCMAVRATIELCRGTGAAHAQGIIHRDIKPHNVLITDAGTCKLADFGIAQVVREGSTKTGLAMGTLGYMAPEQHSNAKGVDARADVFSIGATLWKLLTNGPAHNLLPHVAEHGFDDLPGAVRDVIARCLQPNRDARPPSVDDLVYDLEYALERLPLDPRDVPPLLLPEEVTMAQRDPDTVDEDDGGDPFGAISMLFDDGDTWSTHAGLTGPGGSTVMGAKALPYTLPPKDEAMGVHERLADTDASMPDYVDADALRPHEGGFVVSLSAEDRQATAQAREIRHAHEQGRKGSSPDMPSLAELAEMGIEPEPAAPLTPWLVRTFVVRPLQAAVLPVLLGGFIAVSLLGFARYQAGARVGEMRDQGKELHTTVDKDAPMTIASVRSIGGETAPLEQLFLSLETERDPVVRVEISRELVEILEAQLDEQLPADPTQMSPYQVEALQRVRRLRAKLDVYEASVRVDAESRDSWQGTMLRLTGLQPQPSTLAQGI